MSSVITDMIDCPQCGLPAQKDDFYVVGEEQVVCNWCGYSHTKTAEGTASSKGHGSVHYVKSENGSNQTEQIVRLKLPMSIIERHKTIMEIQKDYDITKSNFYIWNEEENNLECLLGKKPRTIDEVYQEEKEKAEYYQQVSFANYKDSGDIF